MLNAFNRRIHPPDGLAHLLHQIGQGEWLLAADRRACRRHGRVIAAGGDSEKRSAHKSFRFDRRDRIGTHQLMEILDDFELDLEFLARPAWRQDLDHGTGLGTGHANDRAGLQAGNTGELRVQSELRRERHPAVADHEQSDREEQQAGDHENANAGRARGARQLPASLRAHERLHQRLAVAIQLARGSPRHEAAIVQQRQAPKAR